jgi:hypothetical protein
MAYNLVLILMVKIEISKAYDKFRRMIGLDLEEISKTVNQPDRFNLIDLNEKEKTLLGCSEGDTTIIGIYFKKFPFHYNLTVTRNLSDKAMILGSYKMHPSFFSGLENSAPMEALQEFLQVFGVDQSIFGRKSKFFYGEVIQQPPGSKVLMMTPSINPPKGHEVLQTCFMKIEGISYLIFCGLAFCIDYTLYLNVLKMLRN